MQESNHKSNRSSSFKSSLLPILSMYVFTSNVVLKKKSTWIVSGVLLTLLLLSFIVPVAIKVEKLTIISSTTMLASMFVTLNSGIQGVLRCINIFKDTQKEGIEIILLSKPISRSQILIARFLFLFTFCFVLGLLQMFIIIIGMVIVGFNYYKVLFEPGILVGGVFGVSIFSFLVFGMFAALIAMFTSGKVASMLPCVILATSSLFSVIFMQVSTFVTSPISNLNHELSDIVIDNLNKEFKGKKITINEGQNPVVIDGFSTIDSNSWAHKNKKPIIMVLQRDPKTKEPFLHINEYHDANITLHYNGNKSHRFYFTDSVPQIEQPPKQPSILKMSDINHFGIETIKKEMPKLKIYASPAVAINYLNPISAFSAVAGSNSSKFDPLKENNVPFNFSIKNIKYIGQKTFDEVWYGTKHSTTYNNVFTFETAQTDPPWAIALLWIFVGTSLSGVVSLNYKRKDFK